MSPSGLPTERTTEERETERGGVALQMKMGDENGIDHISPLSLTPYYQGRRREGGTDGGVSDRHRTGTWWTADAVLSISRGYAAVREALLPPSR